MPTTEKSIDAVGLMREIRERMSREMEGMSKEEILRYLNEGWRPDPKEKDEADRDHAA
jgi:hypothetical protein